MTEDRTAIDPLVLALELARKQILKPEQWIKNNNAVDACGYPCCATSSSAACHCAEGSNLLSVSKLDESEEAEGISVEDVHAAVLVAFNTVHGTTYPWLHMANDATDTTHAMLIAAYDHAIRELG